MLLSEFLCSPQAGKPHLVVIGHPVSHSRSPGIHNLALQDHGLDVEYHAVDCPDEECELLPTLFASASFCGANVTIPLKKKIICYLDEIDESAREIGAVNTVVPIRQQMDKAQGTDGRANRLVGHNTDTYGFIKPLESMLPFPVVTILGSGGASKAVRYILAKEGSKKIYLVSRSGSKAAVDTTDEKEMDESNSTGTRYKEARLQKTTDSTNTIVPYSELERVISESDLIVNTTPVGMYPGIEYSPVPEHIYPLLGDKTCYDIVYNPLETLFLKTAKIHGAKTIGGLDMFIYQAERSFFLWFNKQMPTGRVRELLINSGSQI